MNTIAAPATLATTAMADEALTDQGARSLTAAVYQRLRQDIITNHLKQNEKLHLERLRERFRVSLSVVREALSRLVADGLVVAEAQRGFRVSQVSKKDLIDVTQTRLHIEGAALQLAIANGSDEWLKNLQSAYDAMNGIDRVTATELWAIRHAEFHRLLLEPCDSNWLLRFRDMLYEQSERYLYMFGRLAVNQQLPIERDVDIEHRAVIDAVLARDSATAVAALQLHFTNTTQSILAAIHIE